MRVLVTGGRGQLGRALDAACRRRGDVAIALGRDELDVRDPRAVERALREARPDVVIGAAAYTDVDRAESAPDAAFAVNADGAATVAAACRAAGIRLLHVSTDFVFSGDDEAAYSEDAVVAPRSVYGASKAAGERAVLEHGGTVVRTSWLFSASGSGFVQAILSAAMEREVLEVVDDQRGCPTAAADAADALLRLAALDVRLPILHVCGEPATTRHAFAVAIVDAVRRFHAVRCSRIEPVPSSSLRRAAVRPASSVLDTGRVRALGLGSWPWRPALDTVISALRSESRR